MNIRALHILTLISLLCVSQASIAQVISLKKVKNTQLNKLDKVLHSYEVFEMDAVKLNALNTKALDQVLTLELGKDQEFELRLQENQVIGSSTGIRLLNETNSITAPPVSIRTYHGSVIGESNSRVALTMSDDYFTASISIGKRVYTIEPVQVYDRSASKTQLVFYEAQSIKEDQSYHCKRHELISEVHEKVSGSQEKSMACVDLDLAIAIDHMMFADYGNSIQNVLNYLATIYNLVGLDYDNEFNDQIVIRIKEVVIATCATCDPWTKTNDVGDALSLIQIWGENGGFSETYDIGIYWSTRVFNDNFAGLAFQDQVCGEQRYIAARRYTNNNQAVRIMMSHEIGHSLGCGHNFEIGSACDGNMGRGPKIMDPIVDPASDGWTNGTQSCDQNSTSIINAKLATATCLGACQNITCNSVTNLNVSNVSTSGISASWNGTAGSYRVRVKEEGTSNYFYNSVINNTSVNISSPLEFCKRYIMSVRSVCNSGADPAAISAIVEIPGGAAIDILYVEPKNCDAGAYDLEVVVSYTNTVPGGFVLTANGTSQVFSYTSSPQTVTMFGINTNNNSNALLQAAATSNSDPACVGTTRYTEPTPGCEISICESFNNCQLPYGWTATTTNNNVFSEPFAWKFDDGDRNILNYGAAQNAGTTKTINGTCAAYFDDDIFMDAGYTGIITLETKAYDMSNMSEVSIEVDYNFHNFLQGKMNSNQSEFSIDVFNGSTWVNVLADDDDVCVWYQVWANSCTTNYTFDVTSYISNQFKVRFRYTDGNTGDWTGMVMLDDFKVVGTQLGVLDLSIIDFNGELDGDKAMLDWDVELDNSFSHYVIERSTDGKSFEEIARIEESSQYIDNQIIAGSNYYRLQVYDHDGIGLASDIIMLNYTPSNKIEIFPNPIEAGNVTVINRSKEQYDFIHLFSLDGKEIQRSATNGRSVINLNVSHLDQGVYLLQLRNNDASKTLRLVRI